MRSKITILTFGLALLAVGATAASSKNASAGDNSASAAVVRSTHQADVDARRVEGEMRFKSNCSRCHAAPHKFPPRMMATIVRHMRVRATITDDDMRLILFYMTQ